MHEYVLTPHSLYAAVSVGLETSTIPRCALGNSPSKDAGESPTRDPPELLATTSFGARECCPRGGLPGAGGEFVTQALAIRRAAVTLAAIDEGAEKGG